MDFFQARNRRFFALHKAGSSFVDSSAATAVRRQGVQTVQTQRNESSLNLTVLFFIALSVACLHLFGFRHFFHADRSEQPQPAPVAMNVNMITLPAAKPELAATPPPPSAKPKPPHKKKQPKPKLKKISPLMPKAAFSPEDQVFDLKPLENNFTPDYALSDPNRDAKAETKAYTEAYFNAEYDKNPKPDYPSIARSRGWQGKVILRVEINEAGKVDSVAVEQSSGHELLDESASAAVREWLFVPAMQANQAIASSVLVPIIFSLRDEEMVGSEFPHPN